ncbi:MAG: hypothetical protein V5A49_03880 [Haloarcula sp.]
MLPLRGFDEIVALFGEFPDHPFHVGLLGNRPMCERGRICTVALAAENDQPLVASIPEYDVVVVISALEDPPVRAGDGSPVLGERRRRPSTVGEGGDVVGKGRHRGVDLLAGEVPARRSTVALQL